MSEITDEEMKTAEEVLEQLSDEYDGMRGALFGDAKTQVENIHHFE